MSDSVSIYFQMGGYAQFVWPAYAVAAAVLAGFTLSSWRRLRAAQRALERLSEADPNLSDDA
jgi:heme exporter protein D